MSGRGGDKIESECTQQIKVKMMRVGLAYRSVTEMSVHLNQ